MNNNNIKKLIKKNLPLQYKINQRWYELSIKKLSIKRMFPQLSIKKNQCFLSCQSLSTQPTIYPTYQSNDFENQ